jgi:BirA family biotin operon repressor/biotin-[acetyl-CoA-carboxylase] ligase
MITTLEHFQHRGLTDFLPQWPQYDALANHPVTLISDKDSLNVIARGINERGELRYEYENTLHTLSNSHVSIRFSS